MKKDEKILTDFKGVNQALDETNIEDNELHTFENGRLKRFGDMGKPTKRFGYSRYNANQFLNENKPIQSLYEHRTQANSYLIAKNDFDATSKLDRSVGELFTADWVGVGSTPISSTETNGKLDFTSYKNKLYVCNRRNAEAKPSVLAVNKVWDETYWLDHGCPPLLSDGMGVTKHTGTTLTAGYYGYLVTFLYDNYQESGTFGWSSSVRDFHKVTQVEGVNLAMKLTAIPTAPMNGTNTRITARKIYRTKVLANANVVPTDFYFLATIPNNTAVTYLDEMPDVELGDVFNPSDIISLKKPFRSKYQVVHQNRLFQGYINDDLLDAIPTADITLTRQVGGGGLTPGVYGYKFYKVWLENNDGVISRVFSKPLQKNVTLQDNGVGADDNEVLIAFSGTDNYYYNIAVARTSVGGTDYKFVDYGSLDMNGAELTTFPVADTIADVDRSDNNPLINIPEDVSYESMVSWSDPDRPDLFTADNNINVGQDDGQEITNIFSASNKLIVFKTKSIHYIDTNAQDPAYWFSDIILSNIGSEKAIQIDEGDYIFYNQRNVGAVASTIEGIQFWRWRGGNPELISAKIQPILDTAVHTVRDMAYDKANNQVIIITYTGSLTKILIYDLDLETWYVDTNTTNLNLYCLCPTRYKGMLYGSGDGYVHYQDTTFKDSIADTDKEYTWKVRPKTFLYPEGAVKLDRIWCVVEATAAGDTDDFIIKHSVDNGGTASELFTLASGINAFEIKTQRTQGKQFYIQIENAEKSAGGTVGNVGLTLKHLGFEAKIKHLRRRDD